MTVGSRAQVYHGNATHTAGGLTKKDLKKRKGDCYMSPSHGRGTNCT